MIEHTINNALAGPCECRPKYSHYCHAGVHVVRRLVEIDGQLSMPPKIYAPECCPWCKAKEQPK